MGLFDFLKKPKQKSLEQQNEEYLAMRDEEERRLNAAYDFNSVAGIMAIPVPCREVNGDSATGRVEYYLRGRCFAQHWGAGRTELALACLRKANELMYVSDMIWKRDDFMRLVYYLRKAGRNDEADVEKKKIDAYFESKNIIRDSVTSSLSSAKELDSDLVEITNSGICCAECAKYRNRVYSISGRDKRFPALPAQFKPETFTYNHVCLSVWPFIYGVMEPSFECKNVIKYSNRPFVDDRTKEEIARYDAWRADMAEKAKREAEKAKRQEEYIWLEQNLPQDCPKSFSAYSRMKSGNTQGYQKLQQLAANMGRKI